VAGLATHIAVTNGQQKAAAGPTQSPWHGTIININRGKSTIDVRREGFVRTIHYNSSTKLTEDKKLVDMSELKEGMDVICLGNYPSGSVVMNATRTDLRRR
jgi:hypothetical protein